MSETFQGPSGWQFNDVPGNAVVSYTLVSQSSAPQVLQIVDPNGNTVVNTSVLSTNLSNVATGSFSTPGSADATYTYTIKFPSDHTVTFDTATVNVGRAVVSESAIFAGEDGTDNDFNDAFAIITWFARSG